MSMVSQQYASLANASYKDQVPRSDPYPIGGVSYKVMEHHSNPRTGYQGTVYQRVDTGEIIVAHRGTETEEGLGHLLKDGLVDGVMVASRLNPQAADAIALTQRALAYAEREDRKPGGHAPEVTVTGHSLGGTLAQVTAHHFGLRGETFNAYGAASLGYDIGKGGDSIINHVKAGDTVSAASPHYGQVRVYASPDEIATCTALAMPTTAIHSIRARRVRLLACCSDRTACITFSTSTAGVGMTAPSCRIRPHANWPRCSSP